MNIAFERSRARDKSAAGLCRPGHPPANRSHSQLAVRPGPLAVALRVAATRRVSLPPLVFAPSPGAAEPTRVPGVVVRPGDVGAAVPDSVESAYAPRAGATTTGGRGRVVVECRGPVERLRREHGDTFGAARVAESVDVGGRVRTASHAVVRWDDAVGGTAPPAPRPHPTRFGASQLQLVETRVRENAHRDRCSSAGKVPLHRRSTTRRLARPPVAVTGVDIRQRCRRSRTPEPDGDKRPGLS